jgi:hypothetical protein
MPSLPIELPLKSDNSTSFAQQAFFPTCRLQRAMVKGFVIEKPCALSASRQGILQKWNLAETL